MQSEQQGNPKRKRRKKKKTNVVFSSAFAEATRTWATEGRELVINGKEVRVYTTAKLVEALRYYGVKRDYITIKDWQRKGFIPKSPIFISNKYFYTRGMIECLATTLSELGIGKYAERGSREKYTPIIWDAFNKQVQKELFSNE